ncbi:MAG: hypothetical protein J7K36_01080 [Archaeoglobaceae archaeon]|nr:hypothetical protein [Archaeoglobaceae archaeon]
MGIPTRIMAEIEEISTRRVNHPQTNGKIERFYETLETKMKYFDSIDEFIVY